MTMLLLWIIVWIQMISVVHASIYLYDSEDSASVEVYDCLYHESMLYCRRPSQPTTLQRRHQDTSMSSWRCFTFLLLSLAEECQCVRSVAWMEIVHLTKQTTTNHYLATSSTSSNETTTTTGEFLCQCNNPTSFGRHCEYRLPVGTTFDETGVC